jgi:hypothetical protein
MDVSPNAIAKALRLRKRFRGNAMPVLGILPKRLIYKGKWWDGWPPHSHSKRLFMRGKYFLAHYEGPKRALRTSGFLRTFADAGFLKPSAVCHFSGTR